MSRTTRVLLCVGLAAALAIHTCSAAGGTVLDRPGRRLPGGTGGGAAGGGNNEGTGRGGGGRPIPPPTASFWPGFVNGDFDPNDNNACKADVERFCPSVQAGNGKRFRCIMTALRRGRQIAADCVELLNDIAEFEGRSVANNTQLFGACRGDMNRLAADNSCDQSLFEGDGGWIACLKAHKSDLTSACQGAVFDEEVNEAGDIRADAKIMEACASEISTLCGDVPDPAPVGQLQFCLRSKMKNPAMSPKCKSAVFTRNVEDAEDIRLDARTNRLCQVEMSTFCTGIEEGDARMKQCLYSHRSRDGFSSECSEAITLAVETTEQDIRLDYRLIRQCMTDAKEFCQTEISTYLPPGGLKAMEPASAENAGRVIACLKEHRDELRKPSCRKEVIRVEETQAEDIAADAPVSRACADDIQRFCANVVPGEGRVHECLRNAIQEGSRNAGDDDGRGVSAACRAAEFSEELVEAKDVLLNPKVRQMCGPTIEQLCGDIPSHEDEGLLLQCLLDNNGADEMSVSCAQSLQQFSLLAAEDIRFNPQLFRACRTPVMRFCPDARERIVANTFNHGALRTCLKEHVDDIQLPPCRAQVDKMITFMQEHIEEDVTTLDACTDDVKRFCADVPDEEGQVHECLRQHMKELSPECRDAEHSGAVIEAEHVALNPRLRKACRKELKTVCVDVDDEEKMACLVSKSVDTSESATEFTTRCQSALAKEIVIESKDIHLNPELASSCGPDLAARCSDVAEDQGHGERIQCLVDNYDSLAGEGCRHSVLLHMIARSNDYRFDARTVEACEADVQDKCRDVPPGKGRVHACLREKMEVGSGISDACTAVETATMAAEATDARLNPTVARECSGAIQQYCGNVAFGEARVLKCLKVHSLGRLMPQECVTALDKMAIEAEPMPANMVDISTAAPNPIDGSWLQLSGPMALISVAALIVLLLGCLYVAFRRMEQFRNKQKGYKVVRVARSLEA